MKERKTFTQLMADGYQHMLPLPLPPAPGIRFKADVCPRCHSVHLSKVDQIRCLYADAEA